MNGLIIKFIDAFNQYIAVEKEHCKYPEHEKIYQEIVLINESECLYKYHIFELIEKYDIAKSIAFSSLIFFVEPMQSDIHENWIAFGEYGGYGSIYALDTKSNEIICIDEETNTIDWYCAKNEEAFLLNLIDILNIETLYAKKQEVSHSLLAQTFMKCVQVAGGEKYKTYYKFILGYDI